MSADSNEFGSNSARSNPRARMSRVIRVQLPRPDGFSWLHTLSTNGADVKRPATHGRTSSVISASGNVRAPLSLQGWQARRRQPSWVRELGSFLFPCLQKNSNSKRRVTDPLPPSARCEQSGRGGRSHAI